MKWRPETLHNAILPTMILNWLTGITLFEYPLQNPQLGLSFVYILLSISAYCYAYTHEPIIEIFNQNDLRYTVFKILKYANLFISACCVIIGWYYYKAYKIIIKRLELLDEALESLGIPNNYRAIFINSLLKTFIWITMTGTVISFDIHFLIQKFDLGTSLHLCYLLHYPIHLNSVVDFTFTSILKYIGLKFDSINLLLKRILSINPKPETVEELYKKHSRISALIMSNERSNIFNNTEEQKKLIILIKHLHMELTKISFKVNKIYQIQITMVMIAFLACMTGFLYILFSIFIFVDKTFPKNYRNTLCMTGWCALYVYRLLNVNSTCGSVSSKVEQFSLQLTQRPLVFTICGFATLDYPFVQGFMQALTTYLVLLIHFCPEIRG